MSGFLLSRILKGFFSSLARSFSSKCWLLLLKKSLIASIYFSLSFGIHNELILTL